MEIRKHVLIFDNMPRMLNGDKEDIRATYNKLSNYFSNEEIKKEIELAYEQYSKETNSKKSLKILEELYVIALLKDESDKDQNSKVDTIGNIAIAVALIASAIHMTDMFFLDLRSTYPLVEHVGNASQNINITAVSILILKTIKIRKERPEFFRLFSEILYTLLPYLIITFFLMLQISIETEIIKAGTANLADLPIGFVSVIAVAGLLEKFLKFEDRDQKREESKEHLDSLLND